MGSIFLLGALAYGRYVKTSTKPDQAFVNADPEQGNVNQNSAESGVDILKSSLHPIHEIKDIKKPPGTYVTQGYVIKKTSCPPPPQPGLSSPCPKDHIIVSESNRTTNIFPLTEKDLVVFVKKVEQFEVSKRYRLKLRKQIYTNSQGKQESNFELLEYQKLADELGA